MSRCLTSSTILVGCRFGPFGYPRPAHRVCGCRSPSWHLVGLALPCSRGGAGPQGAWLTSHPCVGRRCGVHRLRFVSSSRRGSALGRSLVLALSGMFPLGVPYMAACFTTFANFFAPLYGAASLLGGPRTSLVLSPACFVRLSSRLLCRRLVGFPFCLRFLGTDALLCLGL